MKFTLHVLALCAVFPLHAEDLKIGETTYKDYSVLKVEPDGIKISHKDGVAKIRLEQLPPDLVKKYNLDPAKAAAFREKKEGEQKKADDAKAAEGKEMAEKTAAKAAEKAADQAAPPAPDKAAPAAGAAKKEKKEADPQGWEDIVPDAAQAEQGKLWGIAEVQEKMFDLNGKIIRVEIIVNAASTIEAIDKDSARMFAGSIFKENSNYEFIGFPNAARDKMKVMLKGARGKMSFWVRVESENTWPYPQLWVVGRSINQGGLGHPPTFVW